MDVRFSLFAVGDGDESFSLEEPCCAVEGNRVEVVGVA